MSVSLAVHVLPPDVAGELARTRGMLFIECSAKAKTGIQQVIFFLCMLFIECSAKG